MKVTLRLRPEIMFLVVGSIVAIISRWAYRSQYLFHWDSVQFALALDKFDIALHQPHPPGYIFYIWLGRLVNYFAHNANIAFIIIGIIFTILGLVGVFYLTRYVFKNNFATYLATILYLINSSVWFHGSIAEVYIVESVIALWVVFMIYHTWKNPTLPNIVISSVLLGLLGGFRQVTEIALIPLFVYVLVSIRANFKQYLMAVAGWGVANLIWFAPIVASAGGLSNYWATIYKLSRVVFIGDFLKVGVWPKLVDNLRYQIQALRLTVLAEIVVLFLVAAPYLIRGAGAKYKIKWSEIWFWALAIGMLLLIPALTLATNPGYVLAPAIFLIILASAGLANLWDGLKHQKSLLKTSIFAVVIIGLIGFQIFNFYTVQPEQIHYISPAKASIERHDELLGEILGIITSHNINNNVAIWGSSTDGVIYFGTRHLQYYLPDIDIYRNVPDSFVKGADDTVWHLRGSKSLFTSEAVVDANIDTIFAIREYWGKPQDKFGVPVKLSNGSYLVYYDITQVETRKFLSHKLNFNFLGSYEEVIE